MLELANLVGLDIVHPRGLTASLPLTTGGWKTILS